MEYPMSSQFFGEVHDQSTSTNRSSESLEGGHGRKRMDYYGAENLGELGGSDSFSSDSGFYQEDHSPDQGLRCFKYQQQEEKDESFWGCYGLLDNLGADVMSPPLETCLNEIAKLEEKRNGARDEIGHNSVRKNQFTFPLASLKLLKSHGSGFRRAKNTERAVVPSDDTPFIELVSQELSTEEIMRIAGARFIQSYTKVDDVDFTMLNNPYGLSFSSLTDEDVKSVELVELLLSSAEKVGNQQFDSAGRLIKLCDYLSSSTGDAVQRVVYYFSQALQEKIDRETGKPKGLQQEQTINIYEAMMTSDQGNIEFTEAIPFAQVLCFAGVQAILDNVSEAKRIHIVDLEIRNGRQWTILMQALSSRCKCPIEHLSITAIGTISREIIEDTGKRLMSFAQTMNLPLSFNIVMVSDIVELQEDLFNIDPDDTVAVYSEYVLTSFIEPPTRLDSLMKVIRNMNPSIMVVSEVEANHNCPVFVNRFIETLFYASAYFDCLEACMERDNPSRIFAESIFFGEGVKKILAAEGQERNIRNVTLDVWRAFFTRFGMEETELSMSSLYQADLVLQNFACGKHCTLKIDGKSLIVGWKGTPIHSLTAWKFF